MASWIKEVVLGALRSGSCSLAHLMLNRQLAPYLDIGAVQISKNALAQTALLLRKVNVNVAYINATALQGQPFEFRNGSIRSISIRQTVGVLLVEMDGLYLSCELTGANGAEPAETTSPTQTECSAPDPGKEAEDEPGPRPRSLRGVEALLDLLLQRIAVDITDVRLQLTFPTSPETKATVELRIPSFSFTDASAASESSSALSLPTMYKKQVCMKAVTLQLYKGEDPERDPGYLLCTDYANPLVVSITLSQHIPSSSSSFQSVDIILPAIQAIVQPTHLEIVRELMCSSASFPAPGTPPSEQEPRPASVGNSFSLAVKIGRLHCSVLYPEGWSAEISSIWNDYVSQLNGCSESRRAPEGLPLPTSALVLGDHFSVEVSDALMTRSVSSTAEGAAEERICVRTNLRVLDCVESRDHSKEVRFFTATSGRRGYAHAIRFTALRTLPALEWRYTVAAEEEVALTVTGPAVNRVVGLLSCLKG
eukprot:RCo025633